LLCACYCPYEKPLLIQINMSWQPEQHSARFCDEEEAGADGLGADEHPA